MTTVRRRYALTKLAAGDYLLPSNDGRTIWRLRTYEDGPSYGIEEWPRDCTFWGVWKWDTLISPQSREFGKIDPDDWGRWEFIEGTYDTRREAIEAALKKG